MLTREKFEKKIKYYESKELKIVVTVCKLPTGALEVLVNHDKLKEKIKYYSTAYDEDLKLKTCKDVQLMDIIML